MGQMPPEYLPPKELWPQRIYVRSEFTHLPQRFNSTEELPDKTVAAKTPAVYPLPREVEFLDRIPRATGLGGSVADTLLRQQEQVAT